MCGIFFVTSKKKLERKKCLRVVRVLKKRGPDACKFDFLNDGHSFLCNTILNITGKKISKNKKLIQSSSSRYKISFNGEIYNYKELCKKYLKKKKNQNNSDTDVLVELHEQVMNQKIPKILNGMFAYVVYDKKKDEYFISNDVQGEKNLYLHISEDEIIISSNVSSILRYKNNLKINYEELKNYFTTRHLIPFNKTCYEGISVLNPGSFINVNFKNFSIKQKIYENPLSWISKKEYMKNMKLSESHITKRLEKKIIKQLKLMIPTKKFGCIFSGGIDSSLQTKLIDDIKKPDVIAVLHYKGKDKITEKIQSFQKYFKTKIDKVLISQKKYLKDLIQVYKTSNLPVYTHSVVGIHQISKFFKKKKCKVYFAADGCDELFGGYQIYKEINWKDRKLSDSPYSSINEKIFSELKIKNFDYLKEIKEFKRLVRKKYSFIKDPSELNIKVNLFCDYFIQSIKVGNACNDLVGSDNSVEIRNVYIQKNIIKEVVNIPSKFKIDFNKPEKNIKMLLKNMFVDKFGENNIFKKQGFSGYPNEVKLHTKIDFKFIKSFLGSKFFDKYKFSRDLEWKFLNIELFNRIYKLKSKTN